MKGSGAEGLAAGTAIRARLPYPWPMKLRHALPARLWGLLVLYLLASLAHFVHNAEYIATYPNLPLWITAERVYAVWFAQALVGALGVLLAALRWKLVGSALLAVYGALGLDGLLHYTLALCSEHSFVANLTIWAEASLGLALLLAAALHAARQLRRRGPMAAPN